MKKPAGLRRRVGTQIHSRYTRHRLIERYRRLVKKRFRGLSVIRVGLRMSDLLPLFSRSRRIADVAALRISANRRPSAAQQAARPCRPPAFPPPCPLGGLGPVY